MSKINDLEIDKGVPDSYLEHETHDKFVKGCSECYKRDIAKEPVCEYGHCENGHTE